MSIGYSAAFESELFVDLDPGGPQHRRSVLREDGGAGPELLSSVRRQRELNKNLSDLAVRFGVCHQRRRHGLDHQQRGRALEFGNCLERRWRRLLGPGRHSDSLLAATPGRDHLGQRGIHGLPERPGRLGKREFYLLRLRRPNSLHGKRIWRDQFCGAHVGRLPGSGQSTGGCQRHAAPGFINPTIYPLACRAKL